MCSFKVNTKCRQYKKEDRETQKYIIESMLRLLSKINSVNTDINSIFNNDGIIYDRITKDILLYKSHAKNLQLRIVYAYENTKNGEVLYLIDYSVKKKNDKTYINDMNRKYKNAKISDMDFYDINIR